MNIYELENGYYQYAGDGRNLVYMTRKEAEKQCNRLRILINVIDEQRSED